jgi:hypothetical protein
LGDDELLELYQQISGRVSMYNTEVLIERMFELRGVLRARFSDLRAQLTAAQDELAETRKQLENFTASTIHSCGDHCQRPMCVLRRQLVACEKVRLEYQARLEKANLL